MTETQSFLPHSRLIVYRKALQLLVLVRDCRIRDCGLRDQALRSARSVCLNIAEAVGFARATRRFGNVEASALRAAQRLYAQPGVAEPRIANRDE